MKKFNKILSVVMCAILLVGLILSIAAAAFAAEADINLVAKDLGLENAADFTTHTIGGVTFTGDIGTNEKNPPKYYTGGEAIRFYAGNTLTITPAEGAPIAYVTVNVVDGYTFDKAAIELTNATATGTDGNTTIVTPVDGAAPIVITKGTANNSQLRVVSISVTLAGEGVEAPVIVTNVNVDEHMDADEWTFNGEKASIENNQMNLAALGTTAAAMLNVPAQNVSYKFTLTINELAANYGEDWWGTELVIIARSSIADASWCDGQQTGYTLTAWGDMTEFYIGRAGKDDLSEKIVLNINDGEPHDIEFKVVNNADNTTVTVTLVVDGEVKCEFVDDGSVVRDERPNLYPDAGNLTIRANNLDVSVGTYVEPIVPVDQLELVAKPVEGAGYKLGMTQVTTNKNLYFTGKMDGYYFGTTENIEEAAMMYIENAEGGFKVYTLVDGVKNYINVYASGNYTNVELSAENASVFTYNAECKTLVTNLDGTDFYLGSYGEYNTIRPSKTSYINAENTGVSQFPAGLVLVSQPVEPEKPAPAPGTGDFAIMLAVCAMMASAAVIVLVQKKREF